MPADIEQNDDPERAVRFNDNLSLTDEFTLLRHHLTSSVFRFHKLHFPPKHRSTQALIEHAVSCLLANLIYANQRSPHCFVSLSLRTRDYTANRYRNRDISFTQLKRVYGFLKDSKPSYLTFVRGFYDRRPGKPKGYITRIKASQHLIDLLHGYIALAQHGPLDRETVSTDNLVREAYEFSRQHPIGVDERLPFRDPATITAIAGDCIRLKNAQKKLIKYNDTPATEEMRSHLNSWNDFLQEHHNIDLLIPDNEFETLLERHEEDVDQEDAFSFGDDPQRPRFVELDKVRLHRVFNNSSFESGGRFYGGWWQNIPSDFRTFITINEAASVELDYSNLHPAMLYARVGLQLPDDAYSLPGLHERYRKLIKTTFLKLMNAAPGQRIQSPRANALPFGMSWADLQRAVTEKHAPIAHLFRTGIGMQMQKTDSDIAQEVMLTMMEKDLLALPVHDSFLANEAAADELLRVMEAAYKNHMGGDIRVKEDLSLVKWFNLEHPPEHHLAGYDVMHHRMGLDGYDGYNSRSQKFFRSRNADWHKRFGE